jgi:hypothetical protein
MRDRYHRSLVDRMRLAGLHRKPSDVGELTMPANKARASGARMDAVALLKADDRQVGGWFREFCAASRFVHPSGRGGGRCPPRLAWARARVNSAPK